MPKGKSKKKGGLFSGKRMALSPSRLDVLTRSSDDESTNDNISIISNLSGSTIYEDAGFAEECGAEDVEELEVFEEKLREAIDGLSQKSAQMRTNSLESVASAFSKKFVPDFIVSRRITLMDGIERSLKKGRGAEQALAAQLAALLCVQLGATDIIDDICNDLIPSLLVIANDSAMPVAARAKCCWALGLLTFIGNYEDIDNVMNCFHKIFTPSSCKANQVVNTNNIIDNSPLHTAAISAMCLLLTVTSPQDNNSIVCLDQVENLLDSNSLDICLAAGEVIAVMLEQARQLENYDDDWEPSKELLDKLKQLATGSLKYRTKKDRRTQRSAFRDIIRYIENDELPGVRIRFGKESLSLDTWSRKKQYDAFCQALGSGMNLHLTQNDLLRDVLNLGEKVQHLTLMECKQSKLERHLMNSAAFKARTICRARNRDKRSPSLNSL